HLRELNKGTDVAAIKAAIEEAQKAFYPVAEKLYQQANPQGQPNGNPGAGFNGNPTGGKPDDGVVDADFEEVND
ncbi:MAG: molecular chaperone DnaK, partial [Oscillospiraceae bacterium]|nr:molecular chaperone DnaK [Oscillospiraceae bacterium]